MPNEWRWLCLLSTVNSLSQILQCFVQHVVVHPTVDAATNSGKQQLLLTLHRPKPLYWVQSIRNWLILGLIFTSLVLTLCQEKKTTTTTTQNYTSLIETNPGFLADNECFLNHRP